MLDEYFLKSIFFLVLWKNILKSNKIKELWILIISKSLKTPWLLQKNRERTGKFVASYLIIFPKKREPSIYPRIGYLIFQNHEYES
jgi:hypothetical protein